MKLLKSQNTCASLLLLQVIVRIRPVNDRETFLGMLAAV